MARVNSENSTRVCFLSTHMGQLTTTCNSTSRGLNAFFRPLGTHKHMECWYAHTHRHALMHINKTNMTQKEIQLVIPLSYGGF